MLLSNKKEQSNDTRNNVNESQNHVLSEISQRVKAIYCMIPLM